MREKVSHAASVLPETEVKTVVRYCPKCGRQIGLPDGICVFCANTGKVVRPALPRKKKLMILAAVILLMLILLFTLDLAVRSAGPVPESLPLLTREPALRGTSVPADLFPYH